MDTLVDVDVDELVLADVDTLVEVVFDTLVLPDIDALADLLKLIEVEDDVEVEVLVDTDVE